MRSAAKLMAWLWSRGVTIFECSQADIDQWCVQGHSMPRRARGFVTWCANRRHIPNVRIPVREISPGRELFDDDNQRWSLVKALLHNETLATVDRVAGLLVLLYG